MVSILLQFLEGLVIVRNLDFDLAVSGRTMEEAAALVKDCAKAHVEYALEHGPEDRLCRFAPKECWEAAEEAQALGTSEVVCIDDERALEPSEPVAIAVMPRELGHVSVAA